jgi:hypothetical protein
MTSLLAPRSFWPRALAFGAIAAWMIWGPVWGQLLDRPAHAAFEWRMFSRLGSEVCSVRYVRRADDGAEEPLDRFALLGHPNPAAAPSSVRRVRSLKDAEALGAKLCRRLGSWPDIRLYARCGTPTGWHDLAAGESNLCARRPKQGEEPPREAPSPRDASSAAPTPTRSEEAAP